jgi:hypothetical protein
MESDRNGCSTCLEGCEQYEGCFMNGKKYIQYDFRTTTGELFSCIERSLIAARERRDAWFQKLIAK